MSGRWLAVLFAAFIVLLPIAGHAARADTVDEESRRIAKELQCPVCQGATVADSGSDLAQQMRAVIHRKVEQGEDEEQIVQYFVDRYGDGVLISPPRRGIGLAVWLGPVLVLAVGAVGLWLLVRTWLRRRVVPAETTRPSVVARRNGSVASPLADSPEDRVRAELDRFRRES